MEYLIAPIDKKVAEYFVKEHHYSQTLPKLNKLFLGGFIENKLVAVMTFGYGVQPLNTITKIFPSMTTKEYWEIGRMCLLDEMPKNSESQFISQCFKYVKKNHPQIMVIFTWADGMLGKPGFVYQAANFYYAGYTWTDRYFTKGSILIHPRSARSLLDENAHVEKRKKLFWLTPNFMRDKGIRRVKGKQFKYIYFLCNKHFEKSLIRNANICLEKVYPKIQDLKWKEQTIKDGWVSCKKPDYVKSIIADEVSGAIRSGSIRKGLVQFHPSAYQTKL